MRNRMKQSRADVTVTQRPLLGCSTTSCCRRVLMERASFPSPSMPRHQSLSRPATQSKNSFTFLLPSLSLLPLPLSPYFLPFLLPLSLSLLVDCTTSFMLSAHTLNWIISSGISCGTAKIRFTDTGFHSSWTQRRMLEKAIHQCCRPPKSQSPSPLSPKLVDLAVVGMRKQFPCSILTLPVRSFPLA